MQQRSSKEDAKDHLPAAIIDQQLFSLDIKADQLRFFLEQVVNLLNSHSTLINNMQLDLTKKIYSSQLETSLNKIGDSIVIKDSDLLKAVTLMLEKPIQENTGQPVEDATHKIVNKENLINTSLVFLNRRFKDYDIKIDKIEKDISDRVKKDEFKAKIKKSKKKLRSEFADGDSKNNKKIHEFEKSTVSSIQSLQTTISDVEKKTLWKIQDCETLLHKRITAEFVDTSCKSLYDKIMQELDKMKETNFSPIHEQLNDIKYKMKLQDDSIADKLKYARAQMKEMQDSLFSKYATLEKLESTKQGINDRINDQIIKVQDLQRRFDQAGNFDTIRDSISINDKKLQELQRQVDNLEKMVEETKIIGENLTKTQKASEIDPCKICAIEGDIKKLKLDGTDFLEMLKQQDNENKRKFDHFEQRVLAQVNAIKANSNNDAISKEEVIMIMDRELQAPNSLIKGRMLGIINGVINLGNNLSLDQTIKQLMRDLKDQQKKIDSLLDFEIKVKKKFREITQTDVNDLARKLESKAEQLWSSQNFTEIQEKLKIINDLYNLLKNDFNAMVEFQEYVGSLLQANTTEVTNIITGNNRVIGQKCGVCGIKGKVTKISVEKTDINRLQKIDSKPHATFDNQEVYELAPNQVSTLPTVKKLQQEQNNSELFQQTKIKRPSTAKNMK